MRLAASGEARERVRERAKGTGSYGLTNRQGSGARVAVAAARAAAAESSTVAQPRLRFLSPTRRSLGGFWPGAGPGRVEPDPASRSWSSQSNRHTAIMVARHWPPCAVLVTVPVRVTAAAAASRDSDPSHWPASVRSLASDMICRSAAALSARAAAHIRFCNAAVSSR